MIERQAVSKGARFDIFRRDGFTCQYCGQSPPDVVLELDHIHPVSRGGTNDEMNLVTSCAACNRGKSDKVLGERMPRPDADLAWLEAQQELAELRRYNEARASRDAAMTETVEHLGDYWQDIFCTNWVPVDRMMISWVKVFGPVEIETAIALVGGKLAGGYVKERGLVRYVAGVLWTRKREGNGNAETESN